MPNEIRIIKVKNIGTNVLYLYLPPLTDEINAFIDTFNKRGQSVLNESIRKLLTDHYNDTLFNELVKYSKTTEVKL